MAPKTQLPTSAARAEVHKSGMGSGVSSEGPAGRQEAGKGPWQARASALRGEYEHLVGDEEMIEREIEVHCTGAPRCRAGALGRYSEVVN